MKRYICRFLWCNSVVVTNFFRGDKEGIYTLRVYASSDKDQYSNKILESLR